MRSATDRDDRTALDAHGQRDIPLRGRVQQSGTGETLLLSLLETHFSAEEAQAQLDTAINWGRYAELFTFQDDRGIFKLEETEAAEVA